VTWRRHAPAAKATGGGCRASVAPPAAREEAQQRCARRGRSGSGIGHAEASIWPPPPTEGKSIPVRFRGPIVDSQSILPPVVTLAPCRLVAAAAVAFANAVVGL